MQKLRRGKVAIISFLCIMIFAFAGFSFAKIQSLYNKKEVSSASNVYINNASQLSSFGTAIKNGTNNYKDTIVELKSDIDLGAQWL